MGILDDAIREHLELKRAHGAAEDELLRKEAEAFGPVRHDAASQASPEETQITLEPVPEDPYVGDPAVDHAGSDEPPPRQSYEHAEHAVGDNSDGDHAANDEPTQVHTPADDLSFQEAADAGAGLLEPHDVDPGPPGPVSDHPDEQHPALVDHDHIGSGEEHAPDPVFGHAAEAPIAPPDAPDAPLQSAPEDPYVGDPPVEAPAIDEPPPPQSPEAASTEDEDVLEETPEFLQDAPEHDRLWFEQKPPRDFDFGE